MDTVMESAVALTADDRGDESREAWRCRARALAPDVLVAICHERVREAVCSALAELGLVVAPVTDGYHLVERIADAVLDDDDARPRLIIADAVLPGCSGLSVLSEIRALRWDTPVVILTELHQAWAREAAWKCGATAMFIEPIEIAALVELVAMIIEGGGADTDARSLA